MKIFLNPDKNIWPEISVRPQLALDFLESSVRNVMNRVKASGDKALRELTLQYDKADVSTLRVSQNEFDAAERALPQSLKDAITTAAANISKFHAAQTREPMSTETTSGVLCWRKAVPIDTVGIYIPGGSAPLFSTVLMLGIPASLAGCREVILCSPPDASGNINAAILFAASLVGVKQVFKVGGAQAIAAMTFGTESVPRVYKIFGPGNQYVTKAKQLAMEEGVAIDMPAGPSEVLVWADSTADPNFVAADLLSQAEHGEDSQVILVTNEEGLVATVQASIERQLKALPRKAIAEKALASSRVVVLTDQQRAIDFINEYAPEHLIINTDDADDVVDKIRNAGSVFLGNYSPEAIGDYASGTNHTLPTNGYAKSYAGVSLESFCKFITYQRLTKDGLKKLGPVVETMAEAEQLIGHKMAVRVRLDALQNS
ncbi:histidinol dehydrogenase [Chryseolinea sp. T2]|uniref:histidinol dehydrogenase n=1 Tax=Chryseolinea sp. T2 TaxID=3129255 RepID=UPI003077B7F3